MRINEIGRKWTAQRTEYSPTQKATLTKPTITISLFDFTNQLICEMEESNRFGNAKAYKMCPWGIEEFQIKRSFSGLKR